MNKSTPIVVNTPAVVSHPNCLAHNGGPHHPECAEELAKVATAHADGRIVSTLEGGYESGALAPIGGCPPEGLLF